jgi:phosphatidylserine/phosphatidylglycerophosphate/cardiolipin synthase-like enzyme
VVAASVTTLALVAIPAVASPAAATDPDDPQISSSESPEVTGDGPAAGATTTSSDPSVDQPTDSPTDSPTDPPPPPQCAVKGAGWKPPGGVNWQPPSGAVFNHPRGTNEARYRIINTVAAATRNAWPCTRIWMTGYLMDHKPSVDALIAAHDRGVQVRIVLDNDNANNTLTNRLERALNSDNTGRKGDGELREWWGPDKSFVTYCVKSCRGGWGVNHAKFYAFEQTGGARNVSMVSSSNLNHGGANLGWNDMYVMRDAAMVENLDAGFRVIHNEMAEDNDLGARRYREMTSGGITSRFFPTNNGADPVFADLNRIQCRVAGRRTTVHISMFQWMHTRGLKFARKVVQLGRDGCIVNVLYGAPGSGVRKILNPAAKKRIINVWNTRFDFNRDGKPDYRVHHKYVLINGGFAGNPDARVVITGTQNWSGSTTSGTDENMLTIRGNGAHGQYMPNWTLIRDRWSVRVR